MNKTQWVENLSDGMGIDDFFQVEICDLRQARNGSLYLHLVLRDRTGRVNARRWDARAEESGAIRPGDFIRVRGFVETYRGRPQVIVRQFQICCFATGSRDLSALRQAALVPATIQTP